MRKMPASFVLLVLCSGSSQGQGVQQVEAQAKAEHRVFRVLIGGSESGSYKQTITTYSEGTTDVAAQSDVKVKFAGIVAHQFAYRGHERWKDGRLQYLASASNDNGTPHTLLVTADNQKLKVKEGGKERAASADVWSTSYWHLPSAQRRGNAIRLLDSDSGIEHQVQMQVVGKQMLTVGNARVQCTHYRVTGGLEVDLWFDDQDRLVRREMMRKGKKAVLELVSVVKS